MLMRLYPFSAASYAPHLSITTLNIVGNAFKHTSSPSTLNMFMVGDEVKHLRKCGKTTSIFAHASTLHIVQAVTTADKVYVLHRPHQLCVGQPHKIPARHVPWTVDNYLKHPCSWRRHWTCSSLKTTLSIAFTHQSKCQITLHIRRK